MPTKQPKKRTRRKPGFSKLGFARVTSSQIAPFIGLLRARRQLSFDTDSGSVPEILPVGNIDSLILSAHGSGYTLRGLSGGVPGQILFLCNLDDSPLPIVSGDSAAAPHDRIIFDNSGDVPALVSPRAVLLLIYDGINSVWQALVQLTFNDAEGDPAPTSGTASPSVSSYPARRDHAHAIDPTALPFVELAGDTMHGALIIDGSADTEQLRVIGHTTQTDPLQRWEKSDGTIVAQIKNDGSIGAIAGADPSGSQSVAIGQNAAASSLNAIALGYQSTAAGQYCVSLGAGATAEGIENVAIGAGDALSSAENSVVLGKNAQVSAIAATAIGSFAYAQGDQSTAIGSWVKTTAARAVAIGSGDEPGTVQLNNTVADSVLLGANNLYVLWVKSAETVLNENGDAYDFRVEGDTDANLLVTDGSADRVGIGTNAPAHKLDVNGSVNIASGSVYRVNGTQVLAARNTGWTAPTATQSKTGFANGATATQLEQTLSAVVNALIAHGILGT